MKVITFGDSACQKTRRYLDSYLNSKPLTETTPEVLRHLESCPACAAEFEQSSRLRARLKSAVDGQSVPAGLSEKIRRQIRQNEPQPSTITSWIRRGGVAAAVLLVTLGTWTIRDRWTGGDIYSDGPVQDAFILRISQTVSAVLRVGLRDHVHCAVLSGIPKTAATLEQVAQDMGPKYNSLVPLVRASIPTDYRIVMGHQCDYAGRLYVHLAMSNGRNLMSLVITHKEKNESLAALVSTLTASGVRVYQAGAQQYEVAGFETGDYLAFVVSDLSAKDNLQVAGNLASSVHAFLSAMHS
jgi:hypothetical protein